LTIDEVTVYRGPSQAGPGSDINTGSPGSQKAPNLGTLPPGRHSG